MTLYNYYKDLMDLELSENDGEALENFLNLIANDWRLSARQYYNLRHRAIELTFD